MPRSAALSLCILLAAGPALANAPPPPEAAYATAVSDGMTGGWRFEADGKMPPACDQPMGEGGQTITFEFVYSGGRVTWTTQGGDDVVIPKTAFAMDGEGTARLTMPDGTSLAFNVADLSAKTMVGVEMADIAADLKGKTFRKCYEAADRSAIKPEHYGVYAHPLGLDDYDYLSQGGSWTPPRFVDTRFETKGTDLCKTPDAQYVFFDLVGPLGFSMGRWNSGALAEKLAVGEKPAVAPDEVANWTIEGVTATDQGWAITATELIPPNGSRGDTTTFTLLAKDDVVTIPEWKRTYRRCTEGEETTEVPE